MRPLPGDDAFAGRRSRTTSFTDNEPTSTPLARPNQPPQMTYFLAEENSIGTSQFQPAPVYPTQPKSTKSSSYGVESLETTIGLLSQQTETEEHDGDVQNARRNWKRHIGLTTATGAFGMSEEESLEPPSPSSNDVSRNVSPSHRRRPSQTAISRPFTPLSLGSPIPTSLLGSPCSRRTSDAGSDYHSSQAIVSSSEEEKDVASQMMDSGSAPQLVMPTMKMPSRRPFTETGKNMGRLKVLIAGDSGVGKTALIKAIVQTCKDIVHVDPLTTNTVSIQQTRKRSRAKSRNGGTNMEQTLNITEIYASTRAYPTWWSDFEESRILRRRKSMGDSVLERNLCFVDTPGYGNKTSCLESINPVIDYIESQLRKAISLRDTGDSDMISMLSGNGGSQVDLVFYVFTQRVKPVDIEYLQQLSQLTNIIPLISQSDTLTAEQLTSLKGNITCELQANDIRPFPLILASQDTSQPWQESPYAISSQPSKDEETMDASLLMSPDYIQPLLPSELTNLVSQIFHRDTISHLRHSAARKFLAWRASSNPDKPMSLYRPLSTYLIPSPVGSYTLARVADYSQREERMAQVRLSNWASDLTRSIQNEQRQFEQLKVAERAVWLTERLSECVQNGTLIPVQRSSSHSSTSNILVKHGKSRRKKTVDASDDKARRGVDPVDPLGLLRLNEDIKRRTFFALRVLGSFGVIGGLALWFARGWEGWRGEVDGDGVLDWMGRVGGR